MKEPIQRPLVLKSQLLGFIAMWATRQSPYHAPDGLTEVLRDFGVALDGFVFADAPDFVLATKENLSPLLNNCLLTIPQVRLWNERKNGNKAPFAFVSRYDRPNPDNDFIDLDALTGNIMRSCIEEAKESS